MNARHSTTTLNDARALPQSRIDRRPRVSLPKPLPVPDPEPVPVPASVSNEEPWWAPARPPRDFSTLLLGHNREEWGGNFLLLSPSKEDGLAILATGADRFALEKLVNRTVTISLHHSTEEGNRWGLHRLRRVKAERPHMRFLVKDLDLLVPLTAIGLVGRRRSPDKVKLKITPKKITFRLPPGIR